jgi:hypothetical protein
MHPTISEALAKSRQQQFRREADLWRLARLAGRGPVAIGRGPDRSPRRLPVWRLVLLHGSASHRRAGPSAVRRRRG